MEKLYVIISLDVEEEGLFSGNYPSGNVTVDNVSHLPKLAPLTSQLGFPLTLFCAYSVFANEDATKAVIWMKDHCRAEIGGHLHHWSTPPIEVFFGKPARTDKMPKEILENKLKNLLITGEKTIGNPITSFRMGRWDLKASLLPLLAKNGILVDSSVCPLRFTKDGPNHFLAPAEPYWVKMENDNKILEVPITQIPLSKTLARVWSLNKVSDFVDKFHFFGALSANPFWHSAKIMRMATALHVKRGGNVLNIFWHSSELFPGASPHVPNQSAADLAFEKIFSFCQWLKNKYEIQGITISQLIDMDLKFKQFKFEKERDW